MRTDEQLSFSLIRALGLATLLVAPLSPLRGQEADRLAHLYYVKTNLTSPNPMVVADIVHSPVPEIILTDVAGRLRVYNAETGEQVGRVDIGEMALTSPMVGDFAGDNTLDIAVGTQDGHLVVLDGATLAEMAKIKLGASISVQPGVFTMPPDDKGIVRDRLIVVDNEGVVYALDLGPDNVLKQAWSYRSFSKVQAPPSQGMVREAGKIDIVLATSDGNVVLLDPMTGATDQSRVLIQQGESFLVAPLLANIVEDERDEIIVLSRSGRLYARTYDAARRPPLREVWAPQTLSANAVSQPMLVRDAGTPSMAFILAATETQLGFHNAADGRVAAREIDRQINGISTSFALIPTARGLPEVAFGLRATMNVTSQITPWVLSGGATRLRLRLNTESELRHSLSGSVVLFRHSDGGRVIAVGLSVLDAGHLYAFDTGYVLGDNDWPTRTPWMMAGGSPYNAGQLDRRWAQLERTRRNALQDSIASWQARIEAAMAEGEWETATALAGQLANADPLNRDFRSLRTRVFIRRHLLAIIVISLSTIGLLTYTAYKILQALSFRRLRLRAESAVARQQFDEARRYYALLHQRQPRNDAVAIALARVCIAQRDHGPDTLAIYARAWSKAPGDTEILHHYTRALLAGPATTPEAMAVYEAAIAAGFPDPHLAEYGIGCCLLAAGKLEEAGKRLRSALRGGVSLDGLYHALCEVYLRTGNHTAKALPIYQQQFPSRREDGNFLKAYLAACMDAKKIDNDVETLCHAVLEFDRDHVPAYLHLATIQLQKNQVGAAIEEVKSALAVEPDNAHAISLLAYCFLMQGRKDEEALNAYRRALRVTPADKEILRITAAIFHDRGVYDSESIAVYTASFQENPTDPITLRALAQTAKLTSDPDLAIRSIEALSQVAPLDQPLLLQLANAYVRRQIVEPRTEKVLRAALAIEPDNAEFIALLARVLVAQDRTDIECVRLYEKHLGYAPRDVAVGRQLAKSFISSSRYENALAITKRFLALAPEDDELQRLNALASLYDNKIDEAVSEYKRILERNPNDHEALVNLALAYGQKMRVDDEAARLFESAIAIQPNNDLLHLARARVHVARNNAAAAVDCYKKALEVRKDNEQNVIAHITALLLDKPETLRVRWFLIELLVGLGHLREALDQLDYINQNHPGQVQNILRVLEVILQKDPNNVRAMVTSGRLLLGTDRLAEAIKVLERAYHLQRTSQDAIEALTRAYKAALEKKEDADIRFRLGCMYYAQQEYDEAIGCFQKTSQDYRHEAESTKMLGKCFIGKGMLDIALQEFKKLVVDEETKELLYDLGQRYEAKKDLVGAKTVYRQLFAADINYKDVKTRFEMLSGSTSDPMAFEKTSIVQQMSEAAARRYELLDELGRGAMGIVYRARDKELEEIVALKILPDNMSNNPEAVRRFKIEARNARRLSHPNIVRIHDIGEEMGRKYISMEYVDGSDLKKKVKSAPDGKLPLGQTLKYLMDIADALGYAHRLGIVHRDIKPANIMLTSNDEVKVTDFGIAKLMDSAGGGMGMGEGTMVGAVIGTPLYMSPEQVQGIPVDNRADLYSFGIMMYEMLAGRPPFTQGDLAYQHMHKDPEPIPGIDDELWGIVRKCLAKAKEDRWENAEAIYDALREYARRHKLA
jgi:tetratricopeptide (TPR) repeat protein